MQDIHSIGGGAGGARIFGGGDRRLRPHGHHLQNNQALKCPRCDSLNTKFCYYNNYNLSQPRHFCKSCRRYWTKGGVLRNVPVGGGCRKTKRSKPKQATAASSEIVSPEQPHDDQQPHKNDDDDNNLNITTTKSSNSHSSSESSSLTATNTATTADTTVEAVSRKETPPSDGMYGGRMEAETSKLFSTNPSFEQGVYEQYPDIGGFASLMSTSSSENMPFGTNQQTPVHEQVQQQSIWGGGFDQTVQNELQNSGGRFGALDWQGSGDQGLFDIPNAVDQAYWTQNQWSGDQDHHPGLYLP